MSDRITSTVSPQATISHSSIDTVPMFLAATPEQQAQLRLDMGYCTGAGNIPLVEYLEYLAEYTDATEYLADNAEAIAEYAAQAAKAAPAVDEAADEATADAAAMAALATAGVTEAAVKAAEAAEQEQRAAAEKTLKAGVKAVRQGEKAFTAGWLEGGRLADLYVHQRMALPHGKREVAVDTVKGEFSKVASSKVDVNAIIGSYHAYRLLAEEAGLAKEGMAVPYGHYREAWSQLVQRVNKDTIQESWQILPGVEDEARKTFSEAVANGLARSECLDACKGLMRKSVAHVAAEAKAKADAKAVEAQAAVDNRATVSKELSVINAAKEAAEEAAKQATTDAEREQRTKDAAEAKEALLAKQREYSLAQEKVAAEAAAKARADEEAKRAATRQAEADAKAKAAEDKRAQAAAGTPVTTPKSAVKAEECRAPQNLLATAAHATVKDAAEFAATVVASHDEPDDVLEAMLGMLASNKDMSSTGKRACEAALVVLKRAATVAPVNVNAALQARGIAVAIPA